MSFIVNSFGICHECNSRTTLYSTTFLPYFVVILYITKHRLFVADKCRVNTSSEVILRSDISCLWLINVG